MRASFPKPLDVVIIMSGLFSAFGALAGTFNSGDGCRYMAALLQHHPEQDVSMRMSRIGRQLLPRRSLGVVKGTVGSQDVVKEV